MHVPEKLDPTPTPPGVDGTTIAEKPAPAPVPEKRAPTPTPPIAEKPPPAPLAPIPVCTPPEEDQQEVNNAKDKTPMKENLRFLTENPGIKDLILKIEDMLLDFRSTNQKAAQDDSIQFQQGPSTELIDVYPVSKTKDMYKRYQEKFLAFTHENNINIKKMVEEKSKLTLDNFITKFFVTQGMIYSPSSYGYIFHQTHVIFCYRKVDFCM